MKRLPITLLGVLLLASPVAAGQPAVTPSIAINQAPVSFGDAVTFTTVVPKGTRNPWISLTCYQTVNGVPNTLVYAEGGAVNATFTLGGASSQWVANGGGPASCTAELGDLYWKGGQEIYTRFATTNFPAV